MTWRSLMMRQLWAPLLQRLLCAVEQSIAQSIAERLWCYASAEDLDVDSSSALLCMICKQAPTANSLTHLTASPTFYTTLHRFILHPLPYMRRRGIFLLEAVVGVAPNTHTGDGWRDKRPW